MCHMLSEKGDKGSGQSRRRTSAASREAVRLFQVDDDGLHDGAATGLQGLLSNSPLYLPGRQNVKLILFADRRFCRSHAAGVQG